MKIEAKTQKAEIYFYRFILFLLLISFFEESSFSVISTTALFAMLLLPPVIALWFVIYPNRVTKAEKSIIAVFIIFVCIQIIGIRREAIYTSITPIYRSFTVLMFILYVRRLRLTNDKIKSFIAFSFISFLFGIATIFTPDEIGQNILIGNYNTVGVLYFTLCIINFLFYLNKRYRMAMVNCICCVVMILLSNTRTALFLLIIMFAFWFVIHKSAKSIIKPKITYPVLFLLIVGFVWFYYSFKDLSISTTINQISQALFHKNFDSGRVELWHMTVEAVGKNWLFGCGTGIDLENFYSWVKTPHSVYFDLYLQNGIIGFIGYMLCIITVIKAKGKWNKTSYNTLLMSIVFVLLFYNAVGIVFTKARSGIGLLQWVLIALPYKCKKEKSTIRSLANDKLDCSGVQCKAIS